MTATTEPTASPNTILTVPLRYRVGEVCFFVARVPVSRAETDFLAPSGTDLDATAAVRRMPPHARALLLPSASVDPGHAMLRLTRHSIRYTPFVAPHYYLDIRGTFEEYLRSQFAAKPRHNLTRSLKKFAEFSGGSLDFREYRAPRDMAQFQSHACAISRLTYQQRLLRVGLPDTPQFLEGLIRTAEEDNVRGYVLYHAGTPVAFAHCYREGGRLCYGTIGYDPAYRTWSPGTILLVLILQRVFAEGAFRIFDFGEGEAQYKSMFSTGQSLCGDIYHFRWGPLNLVIASSHATVELFSRSVGRILHRIGLKRRVRYLLRRWLDR